MLGLMLMLDVHSPQTLSEIFLCTTKSFSHADLNFVSCLFLSPHKLNHFLRRISSDLSIVFVIVSNIIVSAILLVL